MNKRKIENLGAIAKANQHHACTLMVLHNILSFYWMTVNCTERVLDKLSVFCMEKPHSFYEKPPAMNIQLTTLPTAYTCHDRTMVSYYFVHSFNKTCTHNHQKYSKASHPISFRLDNLNFDIQTYLLPTVLCEILHNLKQYNYHEICLSLNISEIPSNCSTRLSLLSELSLNIIDAIETSTANNEVDHCVFDTLCPNTTYGHRNGKNLLDCRAFQCKSIYFKCPGYYCIPWRLVCNNIWDCPGGTDEMMNCSRTSCPGRFKCHNTSICLSPDNVCNNYADCMLGDDEYFCSLNLPPCPQNCTCIVFTILCHSLNYSHGGNFAPYLNIHISQATTLTFSKLINFFIKIVFFTFKQSEVIDVCKSVNSMPRKYQLVLLDISGNKINKISSYCFKCMTDLRLLNGSKNIITHINSNALVEPFKLHILDLSANRLNELVKFTFKGLNALLILKLNRNYLTFVDIQTFTDSSINSVITNNYKICCVKPNVGTACGAKPSWPHWCDKRLFRSYSLRICLYVITILTTIFNICTLIYLAINIKKSKYGVSVNYKHTVRGIILGDSFNCLSLLILLIADSGN